MEFELVVDAEAATDVTRLKALVACREGRPRSQPVKIIWHDGPDHPLRHSGLTLAEGRNGWRVERLVPDSQTWLPAQPPPVLAEAQVPDGLPDVPAPLAPLAAFEGRRHLTLHKFNDKHVMLSIEKGVLRTVAAERPVARLRVSGEEDAVLAALRTIAGAVVCRVPTTSLAAEGIALATGTEPEARHRGAPELPDGIDQVPDAFAHILGHLLDAMLAQAAHVADSAGAVHQMRVAVRRARSAVSLFSKSLPDGVLDPVRSDLKELGGRLGPTRDWDVFTEETLPAIQEVLPNDGRLERLARAAERRRKECRTALLDYLASPEFRLMTIHLAWFAAARSWHPPLPAEISPFPANEPVPPPGLMDFASGTLQARWKKLVAAGKQMEDLDPEALHQVRIRAKQTRYAAEMFQTLFSGKAASRFIRRLSVLQERLGVLNDGSVAGQLLEELGGPGGRHAYAAGVIAGFMAARTARVRPRTFGAFDKFRRVPTYWSP